MLTILLKGILLAHTSSKTSIIKIIKMKLLFLISTVLLFAVSDATVPDGSLGLCQVDCDTDVECQPGLWCADAHKSELRAAGLDERKVKCGNVGKWSEEVCFDPAVLRPSGGSGGGAYTILSLCG